MGEQPPTPRRLASRSWFDPRIIGGVVLVVLAVVIGAKVVSASSQTSPVWATTRSLAAGTVLAAGDLVAVEVNLAHTAPRYFAAVDPPIGAVLAVAVGGGELLPSSAMGETERGRIVVIPVQPEAMPPGVGHGSTVDLYLTSPASPSGSTGGERTRLLQADLTVQSVTAPSSGGLSGAGANRYQLAVLLSSKDADRLVRTLPDGSAVVVLVAGGS
ncbi:SAF domain-containing protein [Nakamurella antarctica]|uniref:SAF domain-containing protein n=1 Tax=Nakamurella antarctica TaxID=1902245 RepID=UPI0013DDDD39|nr:SAF domain-containing protein [Nakamurella antarctica]